MKQAGNSGNGWSLQSRRRKNNRLPFGSLLFCQTHAHNIQKPVIDSPIRNRATNAQPQPTM